jgi:hypothetical protein
MIQWKKEPMVDVSVEEGTRRFCFSGTKSPQILFQWKKEPMEYVPDEFSMHTNDLSVEEGTHRFCFSGKKDQTEYVSVDEGTYGICSR